MFLMTQSVLSLKAKKQLNLGFPTFKLPVSTKLF